MPPWLSDSLYLFCAGVLVLLNGFFVAAEFALVKVRSSRLDELVKQGRPFARIARWLGQRLDGSLSACQLGITMASLGLGWVGEPAFAHLLEPVLTAVGITSAQALHTSAFLLAFTTITALHLVVGEQAPKIFAIRRPEFMLLWCAAPLMFFYVVFYPFLSLLSHCTSVLLRLAGLKETSGHEAPHSDAEIRAIVAQARTHGDLSRVEHRLIDAVFEFDDQLCRRVMVPRNDVVVFDVNHPVSECIEIVRRTQHTRYPVCEGSLDKVLGVVHIKDLLTLAGNESDSLRSIMRPPRQVPETMPVSRLLRHFQATHQLLAFVVDEYGTVVGIVTLENVLEQIVGPVEDEFDAEPPNIVPDGPGQYVILGSTRVEAVSQSLNLELDTEYEDADVDTLSGLLMARIGRILEAGDRVELNGAAAEVLEVKGTRATRIRVTIGEDGGTDDQQKSASE